MSEGLGELKWACPLCSVYTSLFVEIPQIGEPFSHSEIEPSAEMSYSFIITRRHGSVRLEENVMDQVKIGKFIACMRKKRSLSQKQLAERIDVTDKTISKWETGNRLPDASLLPRLSQELEIDVNELLAGEEFLSENFSSEEYVKKSESNLVSLVDEINENEKKKKSRGIGTFAGALCMILAFVGLLSSSLPRGRFLDLLDIPTLLYLAGSKFLIISFGGWFHDYLNAWKTCLPKREMTGKEMAASLQAVRYTGILSLTLGGVISSVSLFSLLFYGDEYISMGTALAQIVLTLFYTSVVETAYVILAFRIKRLIDERRSEWENY